MAEKREVVSVLFKNASTEEFVCSWDSVPYRFAAGKEMYVEDWKAAHFAKHWVDRELNKKGLITSNQVLRDEEIVKCLPTEEPISQDEAFDLNAKEKVAEVRKEVKETKAKAKKVEEEEEFPELKNNK